MAETLALLTALCYALAAVLQHREAVGERGLLALLKKPWWHVGLAINALGSGFQAIALHIGELSAVQPLLVTAIVFSLLTNALMRREWPGAAEWLGVAAVSLGLTVFLSATRPTPGTHVPTAAEWATAISATCASAAGCVLLARLRWPASFLGAAAGILFGLSAALIKATADLVAVQGAAALLSWIPVAMAAITLAAFYMLQRAFQGGDLVSSWPTLNALDPFCATLLGMYLYGERLQGGPQTVALALAAVAVTIWGLIRLAGSPLVEPKEVL
ncbi:MAG: hypothetical protein FJX76_11955 [Armatimonadetes bacterium]|nr:hypothetical protein [Armatimonadota bacterium]